jgi:Flp pilus assembly pilin Flp
MANLKNRALRSYVNLREASRGQGYVEYILIIAFVGLAVTAALTAFSGKISDALSAIGGSL